MTPVIRISDTTWQRLKRFAVPLEDTPDDAVRRVLEKAEAQSDYSTPHQPIQSSVSDTLQTPNAADPQPDTTKVNRTARARRLPQGQKTPNEAYELPILETLYELGGTGQTNEVLEGVERRMRTSLSAVDYQRMPGGQVRWRNTAEWARNTLVHQRGLLKRDSKRGTWELTERGRAEVENR